MTGAYVYTLWGSDSVPLYVGCAKDLWGRMAQHRRIRPWWADVKRIELAWYADRGEALGVEAHRIFAMRPRFNIAYNPRWWGDWDLAPPVTVRDRRLDSLGRLRRESDYARIFAALDAQDVAA